MTQVTKPAISSPAPPRALSLPSRRILPALAALLALALTGCGGHGPPHAAVAKSLRARVQSLGGSTAVRGVPLLESKAVASFYEARRSRAAWDRRDAEQIIEAIQGIHQDGLNPSDYHLERIQTLLEESKNSEDPDLYADLDVILTDAVAGMVDHVRYGRVHPAELDTSWNVDPRDGSPPLEREVAKVAASRSIPNAIDAARPNHFIYGGLVQALARHREIAAKGGWPVVPSGKALRPGVSDPRIRMVRRRLAISGELDKRLEDDSSRYDAGLVGAVKLFQARHRLEETGVLDRATVEAMNVSAAARVGQIRANLERARWVLGGLEGDFLLVNLPAFKAYLIRGGRNVWEARTQIGEEAKQTPSFRAMLRTVVFNPDWTVPPMILAEEVLEGMRSGEDYIAKKGIKVYDRTGGEVDPESVGWTSATPENFPYTLRQPPGEDNALGRVKFLFPNKYSIYLHDTPSKHLFESGKRTFSHGCIRIERPLELAELLLSPQGWSGGKIDEALATGETMNVDLKRPIPIVIVYWTVSVGATGEVRFAQDIYDFDPPLLKALDAPPQPAHGVPRGG